MTTIEVHCSHEQMHPTQLLQDVQRAEQVGFDAAMLAGVTSPERMGYPCKPVCVPEGASTFRSWT